MEKDHEKTVLLDFGKNSRFIAGRKQNKKKHQTAKDFHNFHGINHPSIPILLCHFHKFLLHNRLIIIYQRFRVVPLFQVLAYFNLFFHVFTKETITQHGHRKSCSCCD